MNPAERSTTAYDEVLYPAAVHVHTAPDRLATVGVLRGMQPAPVDHCRVLELGCGVGTNLISMAFNYPQSRFLGIDLAHDPIAAGQKSISELGLKNIELEQLDLCEANQQRFGSFDYIIAHGLYSWVPHAVREHILFLCRDMLSPQGIAYISYNAYPGNHLRDLARGIIRFHAGHFEIPPEKIRQARAVLKFLSEATLTQNAYTTALKSEFERAVKYRDEAFFHDDLSEINHSFYFHEFMSDAHRHGLQFVGDSRPNEINPGRVTGEVLSKLKELEGNSEIVREQYKDFVTGCGFRRTLLCHREVQLPVRRMPEMVSKLYLSCEALPGEASHEIPAEVTVFRLADGAEFEIAHPLISTALKHLSSEWPRTVSFVELLDHISSSPAGSAGGFLSNTDAGLLAEALLQGYESGLLDLHVRPRPVVNQVSAHPRCTMLARIQARDTEFATSQLHKFVRFEDALSRYLVSLLDGTLDHEAILRQLEAFVLSGHDEVSRRALGTPPLEFRKNLAERLNRNLANLARAGMLIG
jgi:cyclopropane fatty-acyl-phospholipid synthase-like methyltransferase/methyltransferase-like protein